MQKGKVNVGLLVVQIPIVVQFLFSCSVAVQLLFNFCSIVVPLLSGPEKCMDASLFYLEFGFVHSGGISVHWQIIC